MRVPNATFAMLRRPSALGGTADGTRRSTVGTLNMGSWAGTGEALAWDIASDVPSTSPSHGSNSGAHGESYSMHTYAFKRSCTYDSCNEPLGYGATRSTGSNERLHFLLRRRHSPLCLEAALPCCAGGRTGPLMTSDDMHSYFYGGGTAHTSYPFFGGGIRPSVPLAKKAGSP